MPESITKIDTCAFKDCRILRIYEFPTALERIESGAFENCASIEKILFRESLTFIGMESFAYCTSIGAIYCKGPVPPHEDPSENAGSCFIGVGYNTPIYVPSSSLELYRMTPPWCWMGNIIGVDWPSGIGVVEEASKQQVTTHGNQLEMSCGDETTPFAIYSSDGKLVQQGTVTGGAGTVQLPSNGLYLVRIAGTTHKVIVR